MSSKAESVKQELIQDKCQVIFGNFLPEEDNKYCVDCDAKGEMFVGQQGYAQVGMPGNSAVPADGISPCSVSRSKRDSELEEDCELEEDPELKGDFELEDDSELLHLEGTEILRHEIYRLKIKYALSYLDEVKSKFPQVYNNFLDIMKELELPNINATGVILRLSNLFQGYPELLAGFNVLLPLHYKTNYTHSSESNHSCPSMSPHSSSGNAVNKPDVECLPTSHPVEFNYALDYIDKIKNRFQGQPDIFKKFLELLETYQNEQRNLEDGVHSVRKPLTGAELYAQVAKLFQNQDDLVREFRLLILPDAHSAAANALVDLVCNVEKNFVFAVEPR